MLGYQRAWDHDDGVAIPLLSYITVSRDFWGELWGSLYAGDAILPFTELFVSVLVEYLLLLEEGVAVANFTLFLSSLVVFLVGVVF